MIPNCNRFVSLYRSYFVNVMVEENDVSGQFENVSIILSILVFILIILLRSRGKGLLKNYAILIDILFDVH